MPRAGLRIRARRNPFPHARGTPRIGALARQRADRGLLEAVRPREDFRRVLPGGAVALLRREHDGMKYWSRAGYTGRITQRRAIEVADPYAYGDVAGVADRPVVVIGLRGSRFPRDGERKPRRPIT